MTINSRIKKAVLMICLVTVIASGAAFVSAPRTAHAQGVPNFTGWDWQSIMAHLKDFTLDHIAVMIANQIIQRMTASVVNWINSGFQGSPAFLTNPEGFFEDAADQVTGYFINQNGPLALLCSPYSPSIRLALALQQTQAMSQRYTCTLGTAILNTQNKIQNGNYIPSVSVGYSSNGATLGSIANGSILSNSNQLSIGGSSVQGFLNGQFMQGGWPAYIAMSTSPQNNFSGSYYMAQSDLAQQIAAKQKSINTDLNRGNGFLSWDSCKDISDDSAAELVGTNSSGVDIDRFNQLTNAADQVQQVGGLGGKGPSKYTATYKTGQSTSVQANLDAKTGELKYQNCQTETPGSIIGGTLQRQLNIPADKLVLVKTISDSIDAIMGALVNQMITQGLAALSSQGSGGQKSYAKQLAEESQKLGGSIDAANGITSSLNPTNPMLASYMTTYDKAVNVVTASKTSLETAKVCFNNKLSQLPANSLYAPSIQSEIDQINSEETGQVDIELAFLMGKQQSIQDEIDSENAAQAATSTNDVSSLTDNNAFGDDSSASNPFENLRGNVSGYQGTVQKNLNDVASTTLTAATAQKDLDDAQNKAKQWDKDAKSFQNDCNKTIIGI